MNQLANFGLARLSNKEIPMIPRGKATPREKLSLMIKAEGITKEKGIKLVIAAKKKKPAPENKR